MRPLLVELNVRPNVPLTLATLVWLLGAASSTAVDPQTSPAPDPAEFPRLLPEPGDWERLMAGAEKAENLRRKWLRVLDDGETAAHKLGALMAQFERIVSEEIAPPRPRLERFEWDPLNLAARFQDDHGIADHGSGFAEFSGRWYGLWDRWEVNHLWSPARRLEPAWSLPNAAHPLHIVELQYAWIGDGFGWNLLTHPHRDRPERVILGAVYHSSVERPRDAHTFRPHVGVRPGPGQLIWITENEVFYEEALPDKWRYAITGFYIGFDDMGVPHFSGPGFQALYANTDGPRVPFFRFPLPQPN